MIWVTHPSRQVKSRVALPHTGCVGWYIKTRQAEFGITYSRGNNKTICVISKRFTIRSWPRMVGGCICLINADIYRNIRLIGRPIRWDQAVVYFRARAQLFQDQRPRRSRKRRISTSAHRSRRRKHWAEAARWLELSTTSSFLFPASERTATTTINRRTGIQDQLWYRISTRTKSVWLQQRAQEIEGKSKHFSSSYIQVCVQAITAANLQLEFPPVDINAAWVRLALLNAPTSQLSNGVFFINIRASELKRRLFRHLTPTCAVLHIQHLQASSQVSSQVASLKEAYWL